MPSLTPSTNRYLISGRRLRSRSPMRRLSAVGGMTPMVHFSRPASRIFAISGRDISSLPRISSAFSRTSITSCQICLYSSARFRLPPAEALFAHSSRVSAASRVSRCSIRRRIKLLKEIVLGRCRKGWKGVMTFSLRMLMASMASAPSRTKP